ncbi:tRNA synthetases class I-domain-containing protein [Auriculariales sp. MPI-PUGE-AT-0066]|nr:tRNA synthetases class I-domain-containing protein [Auriculariales sp. MPI-PUGE-AT-0066]
MSSTADATPPPAAPPAAPDSAVAGASKKNAAKDDKKAAKLAKFAEKAAAKAANAVTTIVGGEKKAKGEKPKKVEEPEFVNATPAGEKKDLSEPMSTGYNPIAVESAWYDWWQEQGYFRPSLTPEGDILPAGSFVIVLPPPNVTGSLHIGHGLTIAIEDTLVRWYRMKGYSTLFIPGFDHAGIATQAVVEKRLAKTTGETRHDLGREKFVEKVFEWKNDYQTRITSQLRRLGGSCDWDRAAFPWTIHSLKVQARYRAVTENFCRLFEDGVLYRANRLVNWCTKLQTTLSNLEVDKKDLPGRTLMNVPGYPDNERVEFGVLTSFAYLLEGSEERVVVATTRPETMLGDTAIAVHPDDTRYKHLHGKFARHPFVPERKIPIVADSMVDMEFGTGAVKITPAHDPNDYEVAVRHNLEFINILNDDGTLNENVGEKFKGMKRFHARRKVVEALTELGLYVEAKNNPMTIPICSRSGDVVEPVMKPQWWINCKPLADEAVKRTQAGEVLIRPQQCEDEFYRWMADFRDWCISRQLWWGHRCPAYLVKIDGETPDGSDVKSWVVGRTLEEARSRAAEKAQGRPFTLSKTRTFWTHVAICQLSCLHIPMQTADMEKFFPTSMLETGWDILPFWVARMVMLGIKLTGKVPFKEVFCHAMVRDAHGRKMSKSLGNVIDPVDVIQGTTLEKLHEQLLSGNLDAKEIDMAKKGQKSDYPNGIPQCGTDALRFALCAYSGGGRDINLDVLRVEGYRKFCNKLWNATKFAMLKLDDSFVPNPSSLPTRQETLVEKWILHKLNFAVQEINSQLSARNFMAATSAAYNFWLYELCDVYIEAMKPMTEDGASAETRKSAQNTLYTCLDAGLKLLHPFMPFVTEELWQRLPRRPNDNTSSIMVSSFPEVDEKLSFPDEDSLFNTIFNGIKSARSVAAQYNIQNNLQIFFLTGNNAALRAAFESQIATVVALTKGCKSAKVVSEVSAIPRGCASAVLSSNLTVYVDVANSVDLGAEIARHEKRLKATRESEDKLLKTIAKPDYEASVPPQVQAANKDKLATIQTEIATLEASITSFKDMRSSQ